MKHLSYRTGHKTDQDRNDSFVSLLHQVTDDLVVKVLNRLPLQGNIGGEEEGGGGERKEEERGRKEREGKRSREGDRRGGRREGKGEKRGGEERERR